MTETKWEQISPGFFIKKNSNENMVKILTGKITILTDEESKDANQTNQVILEGL